MDASKINGYGSLFRLITPILISFIGAMLLAGQKDVKSNVILLQSHFTNHLAHHQDLEVGYEKRMTKLQETKLSLRQGRKLEERLRKEFPPRWLTDKVDRIDSSVKELRNSLKRNKR